jgi:hypothetical protein
MNHHPLDGAFERVTRAGEHLADLHPRIELRPEPVREPLPPPRAPEYLAKHADLKTETGQRRVVRHGHFPEREIMTGIGQSPFASRVCATAKPPKASASGTRQRSCRDTRGHRRASRC